MATTVNNKRTMASDIVAISTALDGVVNFEKYCIQPDINYRAWTEH